MRLITYILLYCLCEMLLVEQVNSNHSEALFSSTDSGALVFTDVLMS